jgi:hypothetical protein
MTHRQQYAYGHHLSFNQRKKASDLLVINEGTSPLPLENSKFRLDFETNQKRKIYLCLENSLEHIIGKFLFVVADCVAFYCSIESFEIRYSKKKNYSDAVMEYWLVHIVVPLFFTIENRYYFFHAGAVTLKSKVVFFIGDSYAGKSTLTNFFLQKGHTLVSDDKVATYKKDGKFYANSSHNRHRPYRAIEDLGIVCENFKAKSYEIETLFWLVPVGATEAVSIRTLKGVEKFEKLRYATEMDIACNLKERFAYLSEFSSSIVVNELKVPNNLERLDEVYKKILAYSKGE